MGKFLQFLTELYAHHRIVVRCIDIKEIWFGVTNGKILSVFDNYLPTTQ